MLKWFKNINKQDRFIEDCVLFFQIVVFIMGVCFDVFEHKQVVDNCDTDVYHTSIVAEQVSEGMVLGFTTTTYVSTATLTSLVGKDQAGIFLSILATIFTIHIALWALISGTLDKEYMGIYYAEYIFNMKPRIYKQKLVMISSFCFLIMAYGCYIFTCYNVVAAFLLCEIFSIAMSTNFIYGIFKNQEAIKDEIYSYSMEKHFEYDKEQADED